MNNTKARPNNNIILWIFCSAAVAFGLLLSLMDLSEFYNVGVNKHTGAYPFGDVNENQWYYKSEDIYWKYMLVSGLSFLTASVFTLISMIKKNSKWSIVGAGIIGLLFIVLLINAMPN